MREGGERFIYLQKNPQRTLMLQEGLPRMQMFSLININIGKIVISPPLKLFALWPYTACILVVKIRPFKGFLITAEEHPASVNAQKSPTQKGPEDLSCGRCKPERGNSLPGQFRFPGTSAPLQIPGHADMRRVPQLTLKVLGSVYFTTQCETEQ